MNKICLNQGPTALAVGAGGGCLDISSIVYHFYFLSPSLLETARYRLKYCLKGPLSPNQPTNQPTKQFVPIVRVNKVLLNISLIRPGQLRELEIYLPQGNGGQSGRRGIKIK